MSQPAPPDVPLGKRKAHPLVIVGVVIGALLTIAFVAALVIHFMLLSTDKFNWLEAPKHSSLTTAAAAG